MFCVHVYCSLIVSVGGCCERSNCGGVCRSLPKLCNQEEEPGRPPQGGVVTFEPIQHDHDFCERVVINVSTIVIHVTLRVIVLLYSFWVRFPK